MRLPGRLLNVAVVAVLGAAVPVPAASSDGAPPAAASTPAAGWALQLPQGDKLTYQGVMDGNLAGNSHAILYPGGHPLVFLASVLTHAVIEGASEQNQRSGLQRSADRVLEPYRQVLDTFGHRELLQLALPLTAAPAGASLVEHDQAPPQGRWVIRGVPVFSLTQDAQALLLDHAVEVRAAAASAEPLYRNVIRVVSLPRSSDDLVAAWTAEDGRPLKAESASLLASSLDIALSAAAVHAGVPQPDDKPFRTVRYTEGSQEKIERAQVLEERCGRLLLRNLRGWLMSVPARTPAAADSGCPRVAPVPPMPAASATS